MAQHKRQIEMDMRINCCELLKVTHGWRQAKRPPAMKRRVDTLIKRAAVGNASIVLNVVGPHNDPSPYVCHHGFEASWLWLQRLLRNQYGSTLWEAYKDEARTSYYQAYRKELRTQRVERRNAYNRTVSDWTLFPPTR